LLIFLFPPPNMRLHQFDLLQKDLSLDLQLIFPDSFRSRHPCHSILFPWSSRVDVSRLSP
jgi:hypothetical protein